MRSRSPRREGPSAAVCAERAGGSAGVGGSACSEKAPRRALAPGDRLEFITDVEGNLRYFDLLVDRSEVLIRTTWGELALRDGGWFVFGGDVCDRGLGDIRITKALVSLKRRYPERTILLQGNRDASKLRFGSEMDPAEEPGAGDAHFEHKYAAYLRRTGLEPGRVSGCRWMLWTMGCESAGSRTDSFESRRAELRELGRPSDDATVAESFYEAVDPAGADPWFLEYLRLSEVVAVVGDCLFVHAGLDALSLSDFDISLGYPGGGLPYGMLALAEGFRTPAQRPPGAKGRSLDEWAQALQAWLEQQLRDYSRDPRWRTPAPERATPCSAARPAGTLAYYCTWTMWASSFESLPDMPDEVVSWLLSQGVRRVFQGHKPHGECPVLVRYGPELCVWFCDTSYSDVNAEEDTRGLAAAIVRVTRERTEVLGTLRDGSAHGYAVPSGGAAPGADDHASLVGHALRGGRRSRTITVVGDRIRCATFSADGLKASHARRPGRSVAKASGLARVGRDPFL